MLNYVLITKNSSLFNDNESSDLSLVYDFVRDHHIIGIDTENSGLDPHTGYPYCLQIGNEHIQYIIDMLSFTYADVKELLEVENKLFILQNAKYDLQWFYKQGIIVRSKIWDTYLAELRLTNGYFGVRKNLQALEEKYLKTNFIDKSARKDIHTIPKMGYTEHVLKYSAGDVYVMPLLYQEQLRVSQEEGQVRIIEMECEFVKGLAYSEYCGIYLDSQKWLDIAIPNKKRLAELEQELDTWIIDNKLAKYIDTQLCLFEELDVNRKVTINWNSGKQLVTLFEEVGLDCEIEVKGKYKKSVESKHIKKQKDKSSLIPIYLEYATKAKEVSTYGEEFLKFVNPKTGRVHPSYFQVLASGRLASGGDEQSKDSRNANIMVIPRNGGYRACFIAQNPEEDILVNYDYSQMEDVVFANQSKVPALITLLKDGLDGHSYTAKIAFKEELKDIELDDVKKERPDLRQQAKAVKFAINFGGSDFTISNNLGISKKEGTEIYNNYFDGFPGLGDYFDLSENNAIDRGYILIDEMLGSKYYIDGFDRFKKVQEKLSFDNKGYWDKYKELKHNDPESSKFISMKEEVSHYFRWKGAIRRHALNLPCQGTSAQITKIASIHLFNEIIRRGWFDVVKIVLYLHDELQCECPKSIAEEVAKLMHECMIAAGAVYCKEVPLGASGGITPVWEH